MFHNSGRFRYFWVQVSFLFSCLTGCSPDFAKANSIHYSVKDLLAFLLFVALMEAVVVMVLFTDRRSRVKSRRALERQIPFERFISDISTRLSESPADQVSVEIETGLQKIIQLERFDRICWFAIHEDSGTLQKLHSSKKPQEKWPAPTTLNRSDMPWSIDSLIQGKHVAMERLSDLPAEAKQDRSFVSQHGVKSMVLIPCSSGSPAKGVLVAVCFSHEREWPFPLITQLGVIGNLFANALLRKNAEHAERESELRFRRFFESAGIGMAVIDREGHSLVTNPALCSMLGYSQEELSKKSFMEFTHPEDLKLNKEMFQELLRGERESYQMEKRYFRKDGSMMWGHMTASLLTRGPKHPHFSVGMVEDITQRKVMEMKLLASQALLRSTLDSLSARVAILDESGTIIAVNARWSEIEGKDGHVTEAAKVGDNYLRFCRSVTGPYADIARRVATAVSQALEGEAPTSPIVYSYASLSGFYWFQMKIRHFVDNGHSRIVLSHEDITEVMATRQQLQKKQEWLSLALESSNTRIWDWNIVTDKVTWSENAQEQENVVLNLGTEENFQELLNGVHANDRKVFEESLRTVVDGQKDEFSVEFRPMQSAGRLKWILAKGHILRDESGKAVRLLCVNTDITELKQAQIELRRLTARLIRAQEEERQRIARELHDDIGQRLSILMVKIETLSRDPASDRAYAEDEVADLTKSIDELTTDIHQLSHQLHSSKLQHLGLKVALQELCRQMSSRDNIEVDFLADTIDPLPSEVSLCLYRIAQEALLNARKYSKATSVTLTVIRKENFLYMHIKDSGVGFDLRAPSEGLGFINMRERLHMIGGELFVDSRPGEGTEVTTIVYVDSETLETLAS
jgi:PAS domain S-box-containing protein